MAKNNAAIVALANAILGFEIELENMLPTWRKPLSENPEFIAQLKALPLAEREAKLLAYTDLKRKHTILTDQVSKGRLA